MKTKATVITNYLLGNLDADTGKYSEVPKRKQEISRRQIRELISKATDPTKCLKAWGWTFDEKNYGGWWSKIFTLPYPLLAIRDKPPYLQQKIIVWLFLAEQAIGLWIEPYPEPESPRYSRSSHEAYLSKSKLKTSLILQRLAIELPKIIASAKTEPFYDEAKRKQIEVIPLSELRSKIGRVFEEICKTVLTARKRT